MGASRGHLRHGVCHLGGHDNRGAHALEHEVLGCGAHLKTLRRTACGHLTLDNAVTLDELERLVEKEKIPLLSLSSAIGHLRGVTWQSGWLSRVRLGQQEILNQIGKPLTGERLVRILDRRGELVALAKWSEDIPGGLWRLVRVFRG